jgi:hypothetical protein
LKLERRASVHGALVLPVTVLVIITFKLPAITQVTSLPVAGHATGVSFDSAAQRTWLPPGRSDRDANRPVLPPGPPTGKHPATTVTTPTDTRTHT